MRSGRTRWSLRRRTSGERRESYRTIGPVWSREPDAETGEDERAERRIPASRRSRGKRREAEIIDAAFAKGCTASGDSGATARRGGRQGEQYPVVKRAPMKKFSRDSRN